MNFFVYLLFGSLANIKALAKDTTQIPHIIAEKLPQFARFYINLIILQGSKYFPTASDIRRRDVSVPSSAVWSTFCVSFRPRWVQNTPRFPRAKDPINVQFRHVPTTTHLSLDPMLELQCDETSHPNRRISVLLRWLFRLQIPTPLR